ncbi:DUF4870 domain-containing protein [Pedobacter insulae]|uniref:Uncharacterized membrane protein n=1 Tax=Pedobacter insulae TaxID=414048 RepID=A0A1I2XGH3_9SPHI|nr:hypothetical protein [Pedobacter insulae]SFH12545.1 Uncharacterized membrane protein [Pedobacter insulae]
MIENTQNKIEEGKSIAIIAYLTLIGLIIAFVMNNDKKNSFSTYHIRQSLGLMCTGFALFMVNFIPYLGWILSLSATFVLVALWLMGLLNALNGKEQPIPVVGNLYNKWFANI